MKNSDDLSVDELPGVEASLDFDGTAPVVNHKRGAIPLLPGEGKRFPRLTVEQVRELVPRIAAGDREAKNTMITHNMGLVISVARRFQWSSLAFEDLIQEGMLGLIKAVERYDLARETMFSTYAIWWIRQAITQAICNTGQLIRIPIHKQELVHRFILCQSEFLESGIVPTREMLAKKLEVTVKVVRNAQAILTMNARQVSLEDTVPGYQGEAVMGDFIPDTSLPGPMVVCQARQELLEIRSEVDKLLCRIRDVCGGHCQSVFLKYYGFDTDLMRLTLAETATHFDITRERVRQILISIWKRNGGDVARRAFEQKLKSVPDLEELSKSQVVWEETRNTARDRAFLSMFQVTAQAAVSAEDFRICAYHYGFGEGYSLRTKSETAEHFGIDAGMVERIVTRLWRRLSPYVRHLSRRKVSYWMAGVHAGG